MARKAKDKTVVMNPRGRGSKGAFLLEALLTLLVTAAVGALLLWHWDGFWQTEIAPLNELQARHFPDKFAYEQTKHGRLEPAATPEDARVKALQEQVRRLKTQLAECRGEAGGK